MQLLLVLDLRGLLLRVHGRRPHCLLLMGERFSAKRLARLSMMAALQIAVLYISALLPSGRLAAVAVAGTVSAAAVVSFGIARAAMVFAASAILGAVIVPDKGNVVLFAAFLGYYPVIKSLIEGLPSAIVRWTLKICVFNAALWSLWFAARAVFLADLPEYMAAVYIAWPVATAAFVVYDLGLGKLISYYISMLLNIGGGK